MAFVAGYPGALELAMKVAPRMFASRVRSSSCPTNRGVFFEPARGSDQGCQPAFRVGPTVGPLSVSDRSKCYLVLLKMPRKLLTHRSLQTCQGSGVGSIPIGRSIIQKNLRCRLISSAIFISVTFFGSWPWKHSHARAESDSRPRALSKYISDERGRSQFFIVTDLLPHASSLFLPRSPVPIPTAKCGDGSVVFLDWRPNVSARRTLWVSDARCGRARSSAGSRNRWSDPLIRTTEVYRRVNTDEGRRGYARAVPQFQTA